MGGLISDEIVDTPDIDSTISRPVVERTYNQLLRLGIEILSDGEQR
jgi:hypothetical protein